MALISCVKCWTTPPKMAMACPAFNVNNLEQMRAIMEAADETDSPVIVQASAVRANMPARPSCGT